jgi:two-component system sensor kinase FixL
MAENMSNDEEPPRQGIPEDQASRLHEISDAIFRVASGDFEVKLPITAELDEIDGIARGVSMLAEEIGERVHDLEHYRDLVENQAVGISLVDEGEYFLFANQAAHLIFGVPEGSLVGRNLKEFTDEAAFAKILLQTESRKRGEKSTYEPEIVRPDGTRRILRLTANPRFDQRGGFTGALGIFSDITEGRQAEERSRRHLRDMAFLSETAIAFVELTAEEDIYRLIAKQLQELVGDSFVFIGSYDESREVLQPRALLGSKEDLASAMRDLSWEPLAMEFAVDATLQKKLFGGGLICFPGGLPELLRHTPLEETWASFAKIYRLGKLYAMAIKRRYDVLGGVVIATREGTEVENPDLVEAYIYQAAVALQHHQAEEALRESELRFRSVTQTAIDAIITCDAGGIIISWNKGAESIFGYGEDQVLGRSIRMLMPEARIEEYTTNLRNLVDAQEPGLFSQRAEAFGLKNDDVEFPLEISASSWRAGGALYYTGIIRDITERKKREGEIERMNRELKAYDHTVSHDLRGPLATIKVAVEFLKSDLESPEPGGPDVAKVIEAIDKNVEKVTGILDDLLGMAEVGERARDTEDVDVTEVVREIIAEAEEAGNRVTFSVDDLGRVRANRVHVYQVFSNLMRNAMEHVDAASPKVSVLHVADHRYLVRDNGAGIPEYISNTLFLPFVKGEDGGKGLGLSIVKKIVDAYGGEIAAYNEGGACFEFTLYDYEAAPEA